MSLSLQSMAIETFAPMLTSLGEWVDRAPDGVVDARLAKDMYTFAQQVQLACHHANDCVARLTGRPSPEVGDVPPTRAAMKEMIAETIAALRKVPASAFEGAEERDCSVPIPGGNKIAMDGVLYLRSWSLPHFYFHVVAAYAVLRHRGVALGKTDYLSQVGAFIERA